ncbi:Uncharacterised protein [Yersinia aldovae]|nr:Uncharacterised protein [Yersinia aldovae]
MENEKIIGQTTEHLLCIQSVSLFYFSQKTLLTCIHPLNEITKIDKNTDLVFICNTKQRRGLMPFVYLFQ